MTATIITAKGTKGLLQWLKATQPDFYAYLSPQLIAAAKQGAATRSAMSGLSCPQSRMGRMGDAYSSYVDYSSSPMSLSTSIDLGTNPGFTDLNIAPNTTDAVSAASNSSMSNSLATAISALANGYSSTVLTQAQISANNTLLQTNLARAQQGLPPLTAQSLSTGMTSLTSNSGLLLLGVAAAAALLLSRKKTA